jgi:hypothetical protein
MATMLNGAAVMDAALLFVAVTPPLPSTPRKMTPNRPQRPQRVLETRWGFYSTPALHVALNDPQPVEMARWGLSSSPRPGPRPVRPQRVEMTRWGLPLALNDPQRVEMTRWGLSSSPRPRPRPQRPSPSAKQSRSYQRGTGLFILKKKILRNCCRAAVYQAAEHMDVSN